MREIDSAAAVVVVGVDGSDAALRAVETAASYARLLGCRLDVVHAFIWPELRAPDVPVPTTISGAGLRNAAERIVEEGVALGRREAPDVLVTGHVVTGAPEPVLLRASKDAALLVVGHRGLGGFTGLLLGSVAVELVTYGQCPVLVVRGRPEPDGRVVVGVDGSDAAVAAVELALELASAQRVALRAVYATADSHVTRDGLVEQSPHGDLADDTERHAVFQHLDARRGAFPEVLVEYVVTQVDAREALIGESSRACLVVVGSRGRGGFVGLLLGSVSHATLHHAACPVAVVPHRAQRPRLESPPPAEAVAARPPDSDVGR